MACTPAPALARPSSHSTDGLQAKNGNIAEFRESVTGRRACPS